MFNRFLSGIIFVGVLFFGWYLQATLPVSRLISTTVDFEVKSGTGVDQIANDLSRQKLIRSRVAFKINVLKKGVANKIQAGFFKLSPNMSTTQIVDSLLHAYAKQTRITIPEGLRSEEIALIFEKSFGNQQGSKFETKDFLALTKNNEGKLFPDTYDFIPTASASDVFLRMTSKFAQTVKELEISDEDLSRVTIIASLLEREAAGASEMPDIAGVIGNRLKNSWPLQIDATVQYALSSQKCKQLTCEWWKKSLTAEDLRIKSPFNTYQNQGLPPAPISNPGKEALKAAHKPNQSGYWFYLHDPKGNIHFAKTIEEHNRNICLYLKKDCQ